LFRRNQAIRCSGAILASSLAFIDGTVVTVGLNNIRLALGASLAQAQWVVNARLWTDTGGVSFLGGAAGDTYGLRRIFLLGIAVFGLASLGCGLAWSAESLIAFRSIKGIGAAMLVPDSLALIGAFFPPDDRGRAISTWAAVSGMAAALGPMEGGIILDHFSWRAIFIINLPIAIAAFTVIWTRVPEARFTPERRMDWLGGGLAVIWLGENFFRCQRIDPVSLFRSGGSPLFLAGGSH
jgi:MFS family permease